MAVTCLDAQATIIPRSWAGPSKAAELVPEAMPHSGECPSLEDAQAYTETSALSPTATKRH